jgi:phage terminase small subunit
VSDLTDRQQAFVEEYLKDLNATQAAIRAGYSAATAQEQSSRLLSNVMVAEAVAALKAERSKQTGIDAAWLLKRLADEAEADLNDLYDEAGALKPVHEWPIIWRKGLVGGIKAIEEKDERGNVIGFIREVKLSDRVKRLELIGKHIDVQAFREQVAHTGGISLTVTPEDAAL